jgi:2-phosphoglycolate phosphatase
VRRRPPARLRAVIFDLDGTLVDTADEFVVAVQALRRRYQLAPLAPQRIRASVSNGARALVSLALDIDEGDAAFEQRRQEFLDLYSEVLGTDARLFPGIAPLLQELDRRRIGWGISTNKPRAYTEPLLQALNLAPAPGSVICPDDVTHRKPHPESLYLNCRELGCPPSHTIYVGDHQRDIEAGRRAGIFTVAAAYGYIEPGDDPEQWGADVLVESSEALASVIFGH